MSAHSFSTFPARKCELSVVIPVLNEESSLATVVDAVFESLSNYHIEIIIVDDGSTDSSWEVASRLQRQHPQVRGIRFTRNFGHQAAILAGLIAARGNAIITMDGDGQHPASLLPRFVEQWKSTGADVVQGVRIRTLGESKLKRWSSRGFYRLLSSLAGVNLEIGAADFRLLDRAAVKSVLDALRTTAVFKRPYSMASTRNGTTSIRSTRTLSRTD